jgi:YVTN family beta-propeller protein
LIYDEQHNKVFCNGFRDSILVIDGTGDSVIGGIKVGTDPFAFCYNPRDSVLYCANIHSKTVTVIHAATNTVVATIGVDSEPRALCYDSVHNKVYCANAKSDDVTVIDGAGDTVICTITVGGEPEALAYNPLHSRVYVANWGSHNVTVIRDTSTGIEESTRGLPPGRRLIPTVVRGVLVLPREMTELAGNSDRVPRPTLLDVSGRSVMDLRPGLNDVHALAPGVYFVREQPQAASSRPQAIRKVVVTR